MDEKKMENCKLSEDELDAVNGGVNVGEAIEKVVDLAGEVILGDTVNKAKTVIDVVQKIL